MKNILASTLLLFIASSPALAADQSYYFSADAGQVSLKVGSSSSFPKPNSITIGGGYHYAPNLDVEVGYSIIGDSTLSDSTSTRTLKSKVFHVAGVGRYPINDQFELFGKLGLASDQFDYTYFYSVPGNTYNSTTSVSQIGLMFGIGAQFNINKDFGLRVQYQDLGKATVANCTGSCDIGATYLSVGGIYNF